MKLKDIIIYNVNSLRMAIVDMVITVNSYIIKL
jgi:hypothetical protein